MQDPEFRAQVAEQVAGKLSDPATRGQAIRRVADGLTATESGQSAGQMHASGSSAAFGELRQLHRDDRPAFGALTSLASNPISVTSQYSLGGKIRGAIGVMATAATAFILYSGYTALTGDGFDLLASTAVALGTAVITGLALCAYGKIHRKVAELTAATPEAPKAHLS